jgi:hypothetical protein
VVKIAINDQKAETGPKAWRRHPIELAKVCAPLVLLLVAVVGWSSAARLATSRPSAPPAFSHRLSLAQRSSFQRGIDIDLYLFPGTQAAVAARADVQYVLSLHANAVSVSFPFYMAGRRASGVHAGDETPSPGQVAMLAGEAEHAGLYVSIRPLLDETSLGISRTAWRPARPAAWFASYRRFLLPYAQMAQREHIPELIVGAEFDRFGASPRWKALDRALRRVYHGRLGYARNWAVTGSQGGPVTQVVDAYPAFPRLSASASVATLTRAWESYDGRFPAGTVESEVGIAAVRGAYARPWAVDWPGRAIDPAIQSRWFTAACQAAQATGMRGIYFWALGFGRSSGPTVAQPAAWAHSPGSAAIAACFRQLAGT